MAETFYDALNRLGALLTQADRDRCAAVAAMLRVRHRGMKTADPDDALLEVADQLDTLAVPIGVVRKLG